MTDGNEYDLIVDVPCAIDDIATIDACMERVAARMELEEIGSGYGGGWRDYQYTLPPTMTVSARSHLLQQAYVLLRSEGLWKARALIQTTTPADRKRIIDLLARQATDPERIARLRAKVEADWEAYKARREAGDES